MSTVSKQQALKRLTFEIENRLGPDEILEIYNDLFADKIDAQVSPIKQIMAYLNRGLESDEIVEAWNIVFPRHRDVWFDEDDGLIHFSEESEPASVE